MLQLIIAYPILALITALIIGFWLGWKTNNMIGRAIVKVTAKIMLSGMGREVLHEVLDKGFEASDKKTARP